jgi:hypothetical protein
MKSLVLPLVLATCAAACAGAAPRAPAPPVVAEAPSDAGVLETDAGFDAPSAPDAPYAEGQETVDAGLASSVVDAGAPSESGPAHVSACNEQEPQDFLVRSTFRKAGWHALERAIQYRTDTYGYFPGFGRAKPHAEPPSASVVTTTFMNLPVRMHRKVVPALRCVEEEIKTACVDHPYTPHALAGIRFHNTYRGGEVTNHIYGIAIDVDPSINSCCGCVKPWNDAPICQRPAKTEYDRMAMPECWVHAFERYGFYWLGHDVLKDTMHFEFLGDPDKIVKATPPPP